MVAALPAIHALRWHSLSALHIYALPEDELLDHYGALGFSRLPQEMEAYIHSHIKPDYDEHCIFMYQIL